MARLMTRIRQLERELAAQAAGAVSEYELLWDNAHPLSDDVRLGGGVEVAKDVWVLQIVERDERFKLLAVYSRERATRDRADYGVLYDARGADPESFDPACSWPAIGRVSGSGRLVFDDRVSFYSSAARARESRR